MPADSVARMDSNGSNETNPPDVVLSSSPGTSSLRERTDSESSDKTVRFVLPSMDGSPPKVLTLNEVANVVKNIQNMELAHEIALNPEFKLQPYEPPPNSLESRIKEIMHKAFWDMLREQLQRTPPCFDHAIQLLAEIKECFPQILSQNNNRALERINEILDTTIIKQQAEQGVLNFKAYANFVINIISKSCSPARDEAVQKLKEIDDIVDTFKGILDIMSLMKLDMANFLLDFARNDIMANSVEYEKEKFKEYLEYYKFGFPATENWLQRNRTQNSTPEQTIYNAYMELMDWNENEEFPEVLSMDKNRILKFGQRAKRLCVCASLISICSALPIISQRTENRVALAKQIELLLQEATSDEEIAVAMENVWEQIKKVINEYLQKENQFAMDESAEKQLKAQIMQISNKNSPVRALMWKRLQAYFRLFLRTNTGLPPPPFGYTDYKEELESYVTAFRRVIIYNHSVFGEYFTKILTQQRNITENDGATGNTALEAENSSNDQ